MTTARQLIQDAIIDLGQLAVDDTPDAASMKFGLRTLNRMLGSWANERLLIPYTETENFAISSGSASYTMGSGGTASSVRAKKITDCYIEDSQSYDRPIEIIDQRRYNKISNKALTGIPSQLFYDPVYPVGVIYFYKVPGGSYTAYIESLKILHSTLALGTTLALDVEYEDAIVLSLRNRLAKSYGVNVTMEMFAEAKDAKDLIKLTNAGNIIEQMDMPAGVGGYSQESYNINEG